jgi:hypothetical protein
MTRIGVTGHQRMPEVAEAFAREGLARVLGGVRDGLVGVTSLAAGADQLFARAVLDAGGTLHVVIPAAGYAGSFEDDLSRDEFERLVERAATVETLDFDAPGEEAYMAAGRRIVDLSDLLIAIWDSRPARGLGGTADVVAYARERGIPTEILWPPGVERE